MLLSHNNVTVRNGKTHGIDVDDVVRSPPGLAVSVGGSLKFGGDFARRHRSDQTPRTVAIGLEEFESQRPPGQCVEQHVKQLNDELSGEDDIPDSASTPLRAIVKSLRLFSFLKRSLLGDAQPRIGIPAFLLERWDFIVFGPRQDPPLRRGGEQTKARERVPV